jgi:hypothetical protein
MSGIISAWMEVGMSDAFWIGFWIFMSISAAFTGLVFILKEGLK